MQPFSSDLQLPTAGLLRYLGITAVALVLAALLGVAAYVGLLAHLAHQFARDQSRGLGDITEAQAVAVFHDHRAAVDRLRDLAVADGIAMPFEARVSAPRAAEYRRLLDQLGAYDVRGGGHVHWPVACEIGLASHGNFLHCRYLSFVFVRDGSRPADRPPVGDDPDYARYTALGDGWFLCCQTM